MRLLSLYLFSLSSIEMFTHDVCLCSVYVVPQCCIYYSLSKQIVEHVTLAHVASDISMG